MRPNVDIFNCESSEDLTFRTFERINYEDKSFNQLDLSDSIFHLCTFKTANLKMLNSAMLVLKVAILFHVSFKTYG